MLSRLRDYEKWDVLSSERHDLGKVEDFYFDDEQWTVRYLIVRTGSWLIGRSVLVSLMAIARVHRDNGRFELRLTQDQIRDAPGAELARPVSRQWEATYAAYYGFPYYWTGPMIWGGANTPLEAQSPAAQTRRTPRAEGEDEHLRSAHEVAGYHILAQDGEIGHVEDFLVDADTWTVRYLLVDTSNWIGGRTVLVAPEWTHRIDWARAQVHLDISRNAVKESPDYDPTTVIDRRFEERLADLYRRPVRPI